jgi:hypothetical protein
VTSTSVFRKWISISVTLKISSIIAILQNYFFFANDETKMKELNILLKPSVMTFSGGLKSAKMKQRQYLESNQSLNFRDPKKL